MARLRTEGADGSTSGADPKPKKRDSDRRRVYIPSDPRIAVDCSQLSEDERTRLKSALGVPPVSKPDEPAFTVQTEPVQRTDPALVAMLYKALAQLQGAIMGPKFGLERETAVDIATPKEPLATMLYETSARICDKYNVMGKYADELALVSLLGVWQSGVIAAMKAAGAEAAKSETSRNRMGTAQTGKVYPGAGAGVNQ